MTMIERVAEAIARQLAEDENENLDLARAALEAVREPDAQIVQSGMTATGFNWSITRGGFVAMIDAALAENPNI